VEAGHLSNLLELPVLVAILLQLLKRAVLVMAHPVVQILRVVRVLQILAVVRVDRIISLLMLLVLQAVQASSS
jgi:hypothetical protein